MLHLFEEKDAYGYSLFIDASFPEAVQRAILQDKPVLLLFFIDRFL